MLSSTAGSGLHLRDGLPYLSVREAHHGLHHGHALPVLQSVEGAVVLEGRQVLLPPGGHHLLHNFGLHLITRREENVTSAGRGSPARACNFKTRLFRRENHFCNKQNEI